MLSEILKKLQSQLFYPTVDGIEEPNAIKIKNANAIIFNTKSIP